jgi:hypothetical protein
MFLSERVFDAYTQCCSYRSSGQHGRTVGREGSLPKRQRGSPRGPSTCRATGTSGRYGVIDMAMLSIIRRWHLREHVSLRKIAERLSISRNTVRRYLRNQDLVPQYAKRKTPSKLDGRQTRIALAAFNLRQMLRLNWELRAHLGRQHPASDDADCACGAGGRESKCP